VVLCGKREKRKRDARTRRDGGEREVRLVAAAANAGLRWGARAAERGPRVALKREQREGAPNKLSNESHTTRGKLEFNFV
jgi:hypothetical protein